MTTFIHPCDPATLSQWYGEDFGGTINDPWGIPRWYDRVYAQRFSLPDGHPGIDYAVQPGTPVKAPADGTIVFAGDGDGWAGTQGTVGGGSWTVGIDHGDCYSALLHLTADSARFAVGQKVKQGDVIALSGATGLGTGPHCHWQTMRKPMNVNDGRWGTYDQKEDIEMPLTAAEIDKVGAKAAYETVREPLTIKDDAGKYVKAQLVAFLGTTWRYVKFYIPARLAKMDAKLDAILATQQLLAKGTGQEAAVAAAREAVKAELAQWQQATAAEIAEAVVDEQAERLTEGK